MMRYEHEQMRSAVALAAACEAHDSEGYAGKRDLLMLMQQHNKRKRTSFIRCVSRRPAEAERLGAKLDAMLEKGHA